MLCGLGRSLSSPWFIMFIHCSASHASGCCEQRVLQLLGQRCKFLSIRESRCLKQLLGRSIDVMSLLWLPGGLLTEEEAERLAIDVYCRFRLLACYRSSWESLQELSWCAVKGCLALGPLGNLLTNFSLTGSREKGKGTCKCAGMMRTNGHLHQRTSTSRAIMASTPRNDKPCN